ncbi:hypothetical protein WM06_34320 [Burkholderia cepacia]|uniref:hypothetical protein n=1 Tax=Burkholderia cepacia TaxID=292 RepID=UPI000758F64E|nr:hypothetical protein [Burkholderia cepacia]KWI58063.1 hypothetical protein WM06_34320 [Burkholderia cepacia]
MTTSKQNDKAAGIRNKERMREETAIRQGVKAEVETVPMPVRLTTSQVRALKILAAMEGTTASALIRGSISNLINDMANSNPAFNAALDAAGVGPV